MATLKLNQGQLPTEAETTDGADAVQLQVGTFTALADAVNVGTSGIGVVADPSKTGTNLRFKSINTSDGTIVVANDAINHEVLLSVEQSLIVHQSLSGAGTIDHATIDVLLPSSPQKDAMTNSNSPSSLNPFATVADVAAVAVTGAANINTNGVGVFDNLSGGILNFRGISSISSVLTVQLGPPSGDISLNVVQSQINHTLIANVGVNTHAQIDAHIANLDIHGPLSDSDPLAVDAGPASPGISGSVSRADHKHDISTGTPVDIGTANAPGSGADLALANHVHSHGDLAGGTLHAESTDSVAGFMAAADKSKLNLLDADTYIFRPGGIQQGNVFTSWTDLIAATANSNGDVVIVFDDSLGAITLPAGAYSMDGVIWSGPDLANSADLTDVQVTVSLPEGFTFTNFKDVVFRNSLRVEFTGTTPPIQTAAPDQTRIFAAGNCSLIASGSGPFIRVANTVAPAGSLAIELTYGSQIINEGTEVIELVGANSFFTLFAQVDSFAFTDTISGPSGLVQVRQDASSGLSDDQANYSGTVLTTNTDIAERVYFDNTATSLTSLTVQGAIDEHVNDATIHRVISSTAPVDVDASAASAGIATETAAQDHKHSVSTASPSQGVGGGNAEGTSTSLARADHNHALRTTDGPTDLTIGAIADGEVFQRSGTSIIGANPAVASNATPPSVDATAGTAGVATDVSRSDHAHQVSTASPTQGIGSGNAEGTSANLARADHDHAIRTTDGPTDLTVGSVADGEVLQRSGTSIIGTTVAIASNATPQSVDADAGSAGVATDVSRSDHSHQVSTAAPAQGIGGGNLAGTAATLARSDHNHAIRESGGTDLTMGAVADGEVLQRSGTTLAGTTVAVASNAVPPVVDASVGTAGVATDVSRSDHAHEVSTGAPTQGIGAANSAGVANTLARSDHNHALRTTDGPTDLAIGSVADGEFFQRSGTTIIGANPPVLTGNTPQSVDASAGTVGVGTEAARDDHTHQVNTAAPTIGIGAGNNAGVADTLARSDHNHAIRESGGTDLTMGAVADGEVLQRSGTTLAGTTVAIASNTLPQAVDASAGTAGVATDVSRADHVHQVNTATPTQGIGGGNLAGVADTLARSDHNHAIRTTDGPTDLTVGAVADGEFFLRSGTSIIGGSPVVLTGNTPQPVDGSAGSVGVGTEAARDDHTHQVSTAAPSVGIGGGNNAGVANTLARSDHDHALRETSGPTDLTIAAVADGEYLLRSGSTIISTPISENVFTSLVYRPGGVQTENVYTVWADLITELNNAEGHRVIQFDDSLGAISIPAGTYDMTGVIWECALEDFGAGALVTIVEGVSLPNLRQIRNGLNVRFTGTTPPVSITTGEARFILDTGARIESTSGPFITYNFGLPSFAAFDIYRGSRVTGTPEVIQIASSDVTLFIYIDERSVLEADSITGTVGQVELYISPEATTASTTQTNYTGTLLSALQGKSSQLRYAGTALPAGNMEDTFDTHANDATIHRQISATAPVDVDAGAASAGVATETAAQDHKHSVATAAPSQGIGGGNTAGVATTLARSDHDHTLRETGDPADLTIAAVPDGQFLQRSGNTIIGGTPIFGREASGAESLAIQTTTLTAPNGALGLGFTASNLELGTYILFWSYDWNYDDQNGDFLSCIRLNAATGPIGGAPGTSLMTHRAEPTDVAGAGFGGSDQVYHSSGHAFLAGISGTTTFTLRYGGSTGSTAAIANIRLTLWRFL